MRGAVWRQGLVPEGHEGAGKAYSFNGTSFYRIIDRFIDQGGADVDSPLPGGGKFPDDPGARAPAPAPLPPHPQSPRLQSTDVRPNWTSHGDCT